MVDDAFDAMADEDDEAAADQEARLHDMRARARGRTAARRAPRPALDVMIAAVSGGEGYDGAECRDDGGRAGGTVGASVAGRAGGGGGSRDHASAARAAIVIVSPNGSAPRRATTTNEWPRVDASRRPVTGMHGSIDGFVLERFWLLRATASGEAQ